MQINLLFIFEKKKIQSIVMREMKEKKKKIMENLCEIFFYFLLL